MIGENSNRGEQDMSRTTTTCAAMAAMAMAAAMAANACEAVTYRDYVTVPNAKIYVLFEGFAHP